MTLFRKMGENRGMAAFIALVIMVMLTLIGAAAIKLANDEISIAGNEMKEMGAFYSAEAGLDKVAASIQSQYESTGAPPTTLPSGSESLGNFSFAYNTVDNGAAVQRTLTQGTLAGLNALVKTYTITSTGISSLDQSQVTLTQEFECALVPLFQFAVFYGNDLEIAPGPDMSLIGRVHSNGNLWLQAGSNLYMDSYVTCSGNLLHGRKGAGGVDNGSVYIKDTDGNYQNMKNSDGTFLEATDSEWYDSASVRWDGRVQDAAFGQGQLNLPLTNAGDPHKLIERASGNPDSYENYADIKIIDGAVLAKVGTVWQDITSVLPSGTITSKTFYDGREGKTVHSTDVNMSLLATSSYYPTNGVIYASDQRSGTFNAIRLTNGSDVGTGMAIVSENPMYVAGNFNTVDKQPVSLAADAVTFLSNSWNDSKSTYSKSSRVASQTSVNASIMTGNTNSTSTNYNGGLENLPRFLETWSGVKFSWRGSLVNLWNSEQATGNWGGTYYDPPIRDWAYDTDLDDPSKLPPETPKARIFQRTRWQQSEVGYASE
nr:pilus assembly PilX N-terminal domain-containing protein [candidate division Zixibacteria bacterium]